MSMKLKSLRTAAYPEVISKGTDMASAGLYKLTGVTGLYNYSGVHGQSPWWGSGAKPP